jgi:hypothetical protein
MNLLRHIFRPTFMWEYPDPAGGGGAGPAAPVQPAQGQGQPANEGFWNLFPNVPQEMRPQLEPHIRPMQQHISQLEEQHAPFKPFVQAGLDARAAESLIKFSADFERDPINVWLNMGRMLQDSSDGQPALDPEIDLDHLAALARGEDPDAGDPGQGQPPGDTPQEQQLLGYITQLQQKIEELENGFQQDRVERQTAVQDQLYERRLNQMRETLKKAGYPEELLTNEDLTARILVAKGNIQAATQRMVEQRTALLRGSPAVQRATGGQPQTGANMPSGAPPAPPREKTTHRDGSWGKAREGATARLRRENIAAAQGDK